jgi:F0F1-type ATP synthase membrane subunit b/b'
MTMTEFLANPMAPVAITFFVLMVGFIVALACQSSEPTPEYLRIMAEHNARMAAWEAEAPARAEAYKAQYAARLETMRQESEARLASWRAGLANKGE